MNTTSESGGVTLSSSHTDGGHSATFSYTAAWNTDANNFDESVSVSGSKKVGNWTASSAATSHMLKDATGDGVDQAGADNQRPMNTHNTAVITLTDGSITYKLGDAAHLSTAEKAVNGPMGGAVDAEARVDSFQGFSVGLGVGPGTLTVALDMEAGAADTAFGDQSIAIACGGGSTGFGINFSGDVGADLSFTYATASSSPSGRTCTGDNASNAASANTMGLGVAIAAGPANIALDYEASKVDATTGGSTTVTVGSEKSGFELSATMAMGDATVGLNVSSQTITPTTDAAGATANNASATAGTELWYSVPIGAVTLDVGYGSSAGTVGGNTATSTDDTTTTTTEIGAKMSLSF
jgi:predicted porin